MNEFEQVQVEKMKAEIRKLFAESDKLMQETRWYPLVVAAMLFSAIVAFTKLFL